MWVGGCEDEALIKDDGALVAVIVPGLSPHIFPTDREHQCVPQVIVPPCVCVCEREMFGLQ